MFRNLMVLMFLCMTSMANALDYQSEHVLRARVVSGGYVTNNGSFYTVDRYIFLNGEIKRYEGQMNIRVTDMQEVKLQNQLIEVPAELANTIRIGDIVDVFFPEFDYNTQRRKGDIRVKSIVCHSNERTCLDQQADNLGKYFVRSDDI